MIWCIFLIVTFYVSLCDHLILFIKDIRLNEILYSGQRSVWCFMCELKNHIDTVKEGRTPFQPKRIVSGIQNIGSHMGSGRQEDAHEFMRCITFSLYIQCIFSILDEILLYSILKFCNWIEFLRLGVVNGKWIVDSGLRLIPCSPFVSIKWVVITLLIPGCKRLPWYNTFLVAIFDRRQSFFL